MFSPRFLLPAGAALGILASVVWLVAFPEVPEWMAASGASAPRPAPPVQLERADGTILDSTDLLGRVVVLEVWSTWCSQCVAEIPVLNRLYRDARDRGLEIVGVTLAADASRTSVIQLPEAELHAAYPLVLSSDSFEQAFGPLWGLPVTILMDRQWRIRRTWMGTGEAKQRELLALVDDLLAESAP